MEPFAFYNFINTMEQGYEIYLQSEAILPSLQSCGFLRNSADRVAPDYGRLKKVRRLSHEQTRIPDHGASSA